MKPNTWSLRESEDAIPIKQSNVLAFAARRLIQAARQGDQGMLEEILDFLMVLSRSPGLG